LISAGIWQTVGALLSGFFNWFLVLLVSREDIGLGAEGVGVLNLGSVIFILLIVILLGIKKSTAQKISSNCLDKEVAFKEAKSGTFTIFLTSVLIGTGLIIGSFFLPAPLTFQDRISSILFLFGLIMFIVWYRESAQGILSGIGEYDSIAKSILAFFLFQLVSGLLLVYLIKTFFLPISLILFCFLIGISIQVLFLYKYLRAHKYFNSEIFGFRNQKHQIKENLVHGGLFAITEIIPLNILSSTSILLLFLFSNNYAITGAYSIVGGYALAGLLITNFTWPLITQIAEAYSKGDLEKIRFNLRLVIKLFFYLTFLILVVLIGASQGLIYVFYGMPYLMGPIDIWIPFILTITASAISSFEYIVCCVLLGIGRKKPAAIYLGILFLVTSGLIALFLKLNLFAPSINTGLGYLTGILVMLPFAPYLLRKEINQKIPFSVGLRSLSALLCTLFIAIIVIWPPLNLITISNFLELSLAFVILGFIYLFLLIFFGALSKADFDLFDEQFKGTWLDKIQIFSSLFRKLAKISPFSQYEKNDN